MSTLFAEFKKVSPKTITPSNKPFLRKFLRINFILSLQNESSREDYDRSLSEHNIKRTMKNDRQKCILEMLISFALINICSLLFTV